MTIRIVAEYAGVSTATVSRALNGNRLVTPELQVAVKEAAKKLGYTSNAVAVALRSSTTNTVGMVVPEITSQYMVNLVHEVEDALHAAGIQLLLRNSHQNPSREREALTALANRQVDGVIICPVDAIASRDAVETTSRFIPVVQVGQRIDALDEDWIGTDDVAAMRLVVQHLASLGATSAAFAGYSKDPTQNRLRAFLQHMQSAGIEVAPRNVLLGSDTVKGGRDSMTKLLTATQLPDALVCDSDIIAVGALQTCQMNNVSVPADLIITGHGDTEFAKICSPSLTTVRQPSKDIAKHAVDALRTAQPDSERRPMQLALEPSLVIRQSSQPSPLGL